MPAFTPTELAERLGSGLLSFPVTHFSRDLAFDEPAYRENVVRLGQYAIAGLFAAGGTGEFFSLTPQGAGTLVRAASAVHPSEPRSSRRPISGTAQAVALASEAATAGASDFPLAFSTAGGDTASAHGRRVPGGRGIRRIWVPRSWWRGRSPRQRLTRACPRECFPSSSAVGPM
ncbi:putative 5-dehydro-4-deoxyglucarate dehydratase [Streptomyces antimycoticus]